MAIRVVKAEVSPTGHQVAVFVGGNDGILALTSPVVTLTSAGTTVTVGSVTRQGENVILYGTLTVGGVAYKIPEGATVVVGITSGVADATAHSLTASNVTATNLSRYRTPPTAQAGATRDLWRTPEDISRVVADARSRISALEEGREAVVAIPLEDLAAGADIANRLVFAHAASITIVGVGLLLQGAVAGIDNSNTVVVALTAGADTVATKTYNTATQPSTTALNDITLDATKTVRPAGEVLKLSVTQGATANLPAGTVLIRYRLT